MNKKAMFKNLKMDEVARYVGHIPSNLIALEPVNTFTVLESMVEYYGKDYARVFVMNDKDDMYPSDIDYKYGVDVWVIATNYSRHKKAFNQLAKGMTMTLNSYIWRWSH